MKRIIYYLAIALTVTGCYEEIIQDVTDDGFVAVIEDFADETRTSLTSDNYIAWSESDQIGVFQGVSTPDCFQVAYNSVGSTKASFDAVSTSGSNGYDKEYTENIAIYPYNSKVACLTNKVSGGVVYSYTIKSVQYPETQTYKENSFPSDALVMAAITEGLEDRNLKFRAAGSVLRFKVKGTASIKSITVTGNSDEALSGVAAVGVYTDGSAPTVSMIRVPSSVTLDCGRGVSLNENKPTVFMVCIPPTYFKNGFTVTFTDVNGEEDVRTVTKSLDVQRGHIFGMSEIVFGESAQSGENDYIDEYGINHGPGVEIDGVIWAPVNCGYHETDFKYGKLYQWGRKYGQGYGSDASVPTVKSGPVSLSTGQSSSNKNNFYKATSSPYDWLSPQNDKLWNSGTEDNPVKTEYDPCPVGWRVPTYAELDELRSNKSSWTTSDGQEGYWFSGSASYSSTASRIFLPAAGCRVGSDGNAYYRGRSGDYWSSRPYRTGAYCLDFDHTSMGWSNRAYGFSVRCVQDDAELISVSSLTLSKTSLSLDVAKTATLSATITPSNANHQSAHWWSDNESIATVDQNGKVTAVSAGTTTITAMAGMQTATCTVTVTSTSSKQKDYVDEYGVNHGKGTEIDGVIWAPVNCGYHKTDYKYGKLYQWGRKYGQGYDSSDASVPTVKSGPVSLSTGQSSSNKNVFYTSSSSYNHDWLSPQNDKLWNSGTENNPVKTEYDPCPSGWRVPTYAELDELRSNKSSWTTSEGQKGYWFSGSASYSSTASRIFLPAAGDRHRNDGNASSRGDNGVYWSSRPGYDGAYILHFYSGSTLMTYGNRAFGFSVRCVQDDAELIPVSSLTLSKTSLSLDVAKTATLSATITPSNANHQSAHWWSDNENIATVDQNGKVTAVSAGTATITAMAGMQTATCTVKVRDSEPEGPSASKADDLASGKGNANCYIVSRSGDYKFRPVKGNSTGSVGKVASVQVLWESFGTSKLPSTGDLISAVVYDDGYIVFSTVDNFREGNAVIAAKNSSGTILWSWHIWMTDNPSEHIYANGAGTMMDRNLGALSATPGDVGALGLLYQWGRKDPFLGSSSISSNTVAKSTGSWPSAVSSNSSNGTISYAVEHPMTFISYNTQNSDWLYTGNSSTDNTRWSSEKGLYDPCPAGWRVPDGGSDGIWTKAGIPSSNTYDGSNEGMIFSSAYCGSSAWYPAAGFRSNQGGSLYNVGYNGTTGLYWAVTPNGSNAQAFVFDAYSSVLKNNGRVRAYGQSVRCCKETQTKSGD